MDTPRKVAKKSWEVSSLEVKHAAGGTSEDTHEMAKDPELIRSLLWHLAAGRFHWPVRIIIQLSFTVGKFGNIYIFDAMSTTSAGCSSVRLSDPAVPMSHLYSAQLFRCRGPQGPIATGCRDVTFALQQFAARIDHGLQLKITANTTHVLTLTWWRGKLRCLYEDP